MNNFKISVIMPFFKKRNYFLDSYNSVINQTYKNYEIILIFDDNDASDLKYIKSVINNKVTKIIINKKNLGVGLSRNKGIVYSKGQFIAFLDCDDIWYRTKLEEQINYIKKKKIDFLYSSYDVIDKNGNYIYSVKARKNLLYKDLLKSCDIGLSTVIVKRLLLFNSNFTNLKTKEDYLLWLTLSKKNIRLDHFKKVLSAWRLSPNSLSSDVLQKLKDAFNIYFLYEKQNFFKSCISVCILSFNALKKNFRIFF